MMIYCLKSWINVKFLFKYQWWEKEQQKQSEDSFTSSQGSWGKDKV